MCLEYESGKGERRKVGEEGKKEKGSMWLSGLNGVKLYRVHRRIGLKLDRVDKEKEERKIRQGRL